MAIVLSVSGVALSGTTIEAARECGVTANTERPNLCKALVL